MWPSSQVPTLFQTGEASNHQQQTTTSINYALNQPVITLADRLGTYRQLASGCIPMSSTSNVAVNSSPTSNVSAMLPQSIAANTIVSQSPLAKTYKTSLVERTQELRNWLKQAKTEHEQLSDAQKTDI